MEEFIPVKIYPTDEYLFITIQKVATRLLGSMYNDSVKKGLAFDYNIDIFNKEVIPAQSNIEYLQESVIKDFQDGVSGKLQKKVIILYRNPLKRFKSGIVQDFNSVILDNGNSDFTLKLLFELLDTNDSVKQFVLNNIGSLQHLQLNNSPTGTREFFKESLKYYTQHLADTGFNNPHSRNYIYSFYILLTSNFFELSNIILCDIDENLNELISDLNLNVNYEHRNSNSEFIPMMNDVLSDNDIIIGRVKKYLHIENMFYNILKTHSTNFKKENTQS